MSTYSANPNVGSRPSPTKWPAFDVAEATILPLGTILLCSPECFDFIYSANGTKFVYLHLIHSSFSPGTGSTCILPAISSRTPHMGSLDSDLYLGSRGTSLCCTNSRICQNSRTGIDISRTYHTIFRFYHSSGDA